MSGTETPNESDEPSPLMRAVRDSELLQAWIEASPDGLLLVDEAGTILHTNSAAAAMFQFTAEDLRGRCVDDLVPPRFRSEHPAYRHEFVRGRALRLFSTDSQLTGFRRNGSEFPVAIGLQRVEVAGAVGVIVTIRDLTEFKQVRSRFRRVIEHSPAAILMTDQNRRIVLSNWIAEDLFGYRRDELRGQPVEILVPEPSREIHQQHYEEFLLHPRSLPLSAQRNVHGRHRDGTIFPIAVALNPVETENGLAVIATIVDMTGQRRLERDYRTARRIQQALLPAQVPQLDALAGYDIAGRSEPAEATGGDFFDYLVLPEGQFGVAVGDVSGHGFPAAILAAATLSYTRALAQAFPYPPRLLGALDPLLYAQSPESTFVTMAMMTMHPPTGRVTFSGGGHGGWWIRPGGTATQLRASGPPLGCVQGADRSTAVDFTVEVGEGIVILSDGIAEARSADGSRFGNRRIFAILEQYWHEPATTLVDRLINSAREFSDPDRPPEDLDDMTAVIVRRVAAVV